YDDTLVIFADKVMPRSKNYKDHSTPEFSNLVTTSPTTVATRFPAQGHSRHCQIRKSNPKYNNPSSSCDTRVIANHPKPVFVRSKNGIFTTTLSGTKLVAASFCYSMIDPERRSA